MLYHTVLFIKKGTLYGLPLTSPSVLEKVLGHTWLTLSQFSCLKHVIPKFKACETKYPLF